MSTKPRAGQVMLILLLISVVPAAWAAAGCGQSKRNVPCSDVAQGNDSVYGAEGVPALEPALKVITDAAGLGSFGSEFLPNRQGSLAGLDFNRELAVAVMTGAKPTAGYSIVVNSISQQGKEVFVRVNLVQPAPGAVLAQMITSPFDVVRVQLSDLNPRGSLTFHMVDQDGRSLSETRADV